MSDIKTPLELYKHLPKTNCGDCGIAACLAFAAAVIKEEIDPGANIIFGAVINPVMSEEVMITVIATGFDEEGIRDRVKRPVNLKEFMSGSGEREPTWRSSFCSPPQASSRTAA